MTVEVHGRIPVHSIELHAHPLFPPAGRSDKSLPIPADTGWEEAATRARLDCDCLAGLRYSSHGAGLRCARLYP